MALTQLSPDWISTCRSAAFSVTLLKFDISWQGKQLPELYRTTSVQREKGNISPAWDRVMSGGWCGMILWSTASNRGAPIGWRGYWDAALCATSSGQQHVYLSRRLNARPRNEASADFGKHSGKRLKTGRRWSRDRNALYPHPQRTMREIVHIQAGQCGNQIGAKV